MIRKRFPSSRLARILGWTVAGVTWGAVALSKAVGSSPVSTPPPEPASPEEATVAPAAEEAVAAVPAMPAGGLTVIRVSVEDRPQPAAAPRQAVVRSTPAAASPPAATATGGGGSAAPPPPPPPPAPTVTASTGS